ncbi:MAG: hypothetical protein Q9166_001596 [cf. Caloplaca sp. 2 TL-2023]
MPRTGKRGDEGLVPIYSDEPVPKDTQASQIFWDKILAEAGTPARIHQTSAARVLRVVIPSGTFLENHGSVRLSVQGRDEEIHPNDNNLAEALISPRSPEYLPQSPESNSSSWSTASTRIQFRRSPDSPPVRHPQLSYRHRDSNISIQLSGDEEPIHSEALRCSDGSDEETLVRNLAGFDAALPMRERDSGPNNPWISQMDVDGSSDAGPNLRHYRSTSSLQDPEPGSIGMPFGAQARKAELAAARNAHAVTSAIGLAGPSSDVGTPYHGDHDGYNSSCSSQHLRTRSGGLPRSRLYISQVATSSSPEKRQRSMAGSDIPGDSNGIDSSPLPRQRPKRYRRRSGSFSFNASEASLAHNFDTQPAYACINPFGEPMANSPPEPVPYNPNSLFSSPESDQYHYPTASIYHGSQDHHSRNSSMTYPTAMASHSRNVSSYDLQYNHGLSSRDYSLPLHFRSNPASRTPSNNMPLPFNPTSADENAQYYTHQSYAPTTPPSRISSQSLHATPTRISIYNDSLPAYSQPQTPIGLPRNGLPFQNPYYTAPARPRGLGPRRGRVNFADILSTPTRQDGRRWLGPVGDERRDLGVIGDRRRMVEREDQENVSVEVEAERAARRERAEERERVDEERGFRISEWEA